MYIVLPDSHLEIFIICRDHQSYFKQIIRNSGIWLNLQLLLSRSILSFSWTISRVFHLIFCTFICLAIFYIFIVHRILRSSLNEQYDVCFKGQNAFCTFCNHLANCSLCWSFVACNSIHILRTQTTFRHQIREELTKWVKNVLMQGMRYRSYYKMFYIRHIFLFVSMNTSIY